MLSSMVLLVKALQNRHARLFGWAPHLKTVWGKLPNPWESQFTHLQNRVIAVPFSKGLEKISQDAWKSADIHQVAPKCGGFWS